VNLEGDIGGFCPVTTEQNASAPAGWKWFLLTAIARQESGHTPSRRHPEWWGGDVSWLALPDVRGLDGAVAYDTLETINQGGLNNSSARLLPEGTVAMSRTASIGYVTIMGRPMATSQDFVNWVCGPSLTPWYLAYALLAARGYLRSLASGAIHKTIYVPTLRQLRLCSPEIDGLPDKAQQEEIVASLDRSMMEVRRARTAAEEQLRLIDLAPAFILRHALGGAQTVADAAEHGTEA
jgi:type I restriction enzyme S subunit